MSTPSKQDQRDDLAAGTIPSAHAASLDEPAPRPASVAGTPSAAGTPMRVRGAWRAAFWAGLAVAPVGVGLLVGRRSRLAGLVTGAATGLVLGAVRWQLQRLFTDEPDYEVVQRIGDMEIRRYPARVEAQTEVAEPDFTAAMEAGFRRLAGYIFGGNAARETLPMTAPVASRGERIAMTSPVTSRGVDGARVVGFVMPAGRTVASLPAPDDQRVTLVDRPAHEVAVLRFAGDRSERTHAAALARLRAAIDGCGLVTRGEPTYAGFDPPSTLPLLRRNEVWLELA